MPSRTRRLLLLALPTIAVLLAVAAWLLWPRTAITRGNVEKIQDGMTLAQVEAILGGPARDDSTGPVVSESQARGNEAPLVISPLMIKLMFKNIEPQRPLEWRSNEAVILVQFDPQDHVILRYYFHTRRMEEGPLDRLRRWLRM